MARSRGSRWRWLAARRSKKLVAAFLFTVARGASAHATTFIVDTLSDVADAPFDADGFCGSGTAADLPGADGHTSLREAIIAANHSTPPNTITFADPLRGGTIHITFDDQDADLAPDALPALCGGGTTIAGDIDQDGSADVTIDGTGLDSESIGLLLTSSGNQVSGLRIQNVPFAAVGVLHVAAEFPEPMLSGNRIEANTISGSNYGIILIAGRASPSSVGSIDGTVISRNVVDGTTLYDGIFVSTGPAAGSSINATLVRDNQVNGAGRHGIYVLASYAADGTTTTINDTMIRNNEVFGNTMQGISAASYSGRAHTISALSITNNNIFQNGSVGIGLAAGVCGASDSVLEATLSSNTVTDNGRADRGPGIILLGGSNYACPTTPLVAASTNRLTATAEANTLTGNAGAHIAVIGGYIGANDNSAAVTLTGNTASGGLLGIAVAGGMAAMNDQSAAADDNSVRAALTDNHVTMALGGILLAGGLSGPASRNHLEVAVENNSACDSTTSDLSCVGGFPGLVGYSANTGTENVVSGVIRDNEATTILADAGVAGNSCTAELTNNRACGAPTPTPTMPPAVCGGDCNLSGDVTIDELLVMVNIALESAPVSNCTLGDGNHDGVITVDEILVAVNHALGSC